MYNLANNVWDGYFRRIKEARSLRREARDSPGVRSARSAAVKEAFGHRVKVEKVVRSSSFRTQNLRVR